MQRRRSFLYYLFAIRFIVLHDLVPDRILKLNLCRFRIFETYIYFSLLKNWNILPFRRFAISCFKHAPKNRYHEKHLDKVWSFDYYYISDSLIKVVLFVILPLIDTCHSQVLATEGPYPLVVLPVGGEYWLEGRNHHVGNEFRVISIPHLDSFNCQFEFDNTVESYRQDFLGKVFSSSR